MQQHRRPAEAAHQPRDPEVITDRDARSRGPDLDGDQPHVRAHGRRDRALLGRQHVRAWRRQENTAGQLGDGTMDSRDTPVPVKW
jgi:hypothetical protein